MEVPEVFPKCTDGSISSCKPVGIISYEKLDDAFHGPEEMAKLANLMAGKTGINLIPQDAWSCLYTETMAKSAEYDTKGMVYRNNRSPEKALKHYNQTEVDLMEAELLYIKNKYSGPEWDFDPVAQQLVGYIDGYLADLPLPLADKNVGPKPTTGAGEGAANGEPVVLTEQPE